MELSSELIKKIKTDPNYEVLIDYFSSKISELNDISNIKSSNIEEMGQEVLARRIAMNKLIDIFKPVFTYNEFKGISKEDIEKQSMKYGL